MNIRILTLALSLGCLGACSAGGSDVVGSWRCESHKATPSGPQTMTGEINFTSGGKETGMMTIKGQEQGADIAIEASYTGTWKLAGDQLEEEITDVSLISATVNGEAMSEDTFAPMIAGMKGQTSTSTIAVSKNVLAMNSLGVATNCSR